MRKEDGILIHKSDFEVHSYFPDDAYGQAYRVEHNGEVREFKNPREGAAEGDYRDGAASQFMAKVLERVAGGTSYRDAVAAEWKA